MKIRRFEGTDMRDAMRQVREALGADAVIIETVRRESGVQIAAAVDWHAPAEEAGKRRLDCTDQDDESCVVVDAGGARDGWTPARGPDDLRRLQAEMRSIRSLLEAQLGRILWDEQARQSPEQADLLRRFARLGMDADVATELASRALSLDAGGGWTVVLRTLVETLPVADLDLVGAGGVYALVGPTGVGKTTTIAKLAARAALSHGPDAVGLVTTDTFRVAAREQLDTFGQILGVPVRQAGTPATLAEILEELGDRRLVLVDTAGMGLRDARLPEQLSRLSPGHAPLRTLLTLPANMEAGALQETVAVFRTAQPVAGILTKTDEATSLGGALSAIIRSGLPLAYVANGQRVPEDLHLMRNRQPWLAKAAVELMRRAPRTIDEDAMARKFREPTHAVA